MKTVTYPGGTAVRFQFNGIFDMLPTGTSVWPDDVADHLLLKFSGFGLRIVPSAPEIEADADRQKALLDKRNTVKLRSKRFGPKPATAAEATDQMPAPPQPEPAEAPAVAAAPAVEAEPVVATPPSVPDPDPEPAEEVKEKPKKERKPRKEAAPTPEPEASEEVQPVTPADGPGGES